MTGLSVSCLSMRRQSISRRSMCPNVMVHTNHTRLRNLRSRLPTPNSLGHNAKFLLANRLTLQRKAARRRKL